MSAYAELAGAVREPMRKWWAGTGGWLLVGMLTVWVASTWFHLLHPSWGDPPPNRFIKYVDYFAFVGAHFTLPLVWISAAGVSLQFALGVAHPDASCGDESGKQRALFLLMLVQGWRPLVATWVLYLTYHVVTYRLFFPLIFSSADWLAGATLGVRECFTYVPLVLIALSLMALTSRAMLSWGLVITRVVTICLPATSLGKNWHPTWWIVGLQVALSCLMITGLLAGLMQNRRKLWIGAYSILIIAQPLSVVLGAIYHRFHTRSLVLPTNLVISLHYLLSSHDAVGEGFEKQLAQQLPPGQTVLGYATPLVPYVWMVLLCGGLFAFLYWLMGRPWERPGNSGGDGPLPDVSAAVA